MEENHIVITRSNLPAWRAEYHRMGRRSHIVEFFYDNAFTLGLSLALPFGVFFFLFTYFDFQWKAQAATIWSVYSTIAVLFGTAFIVRFISGQLRESWMSPYLRTFQLLLCDCPLCDKQVDLSKGNSCPNCRARVDVHLPYSC